ncbi:MAG TPA: histidine kinase [Bacteroidales bacterium]|nr:histidine kinase [Bacteroidales bacterium]HOX78157.1 histidine kinase [Bacteroidales bacterium]
MKRKIIFGAIIFSIAFAVLFSLMYKWGQTGNPFRAETVVYGAVILLNLLITGSVGYVIFRKFSKKASGQLEKFIIPAGISFVLFALIVSLSLVSLGVYLLYLIRGNDMTNFAGQLFTVELVSALKQFSAWILIGSALFFYMIWRKAIEREQLLREENLKYKYRNLKSQVNPHFLFNSLNTLSELVYEDAKRADDYIQKLSGIYRYVLENEETDLISLKEELDFIRQYFILQKARDQEKIFLEIDIDREDEYRIIPVSLQLLVENALKHNSMSRENPLRIKIFIDDDDIIVSNNIQRRNILNNSTRMGLSNLKERVRLIMGRELIVIEEPDQFVVKLPVNSMLR